MTGGSNNDLVTNTTFAECEDIEAGSMNTEVGHLVNGLNINEQVVDVNEWVHSLERILEDVPSYMCIPGHPGRISRIPEQLRDANIKAYEPYILSIGPYHHNKPSVQPLEKRKWMALKCVIQMRQNIRLTDYLEELKSIETAARSFYSEIEMESEEFVQMLLLDSLYILTLFCGMPSSWRNMNPSENADTNERTNQINQAMEFREESDEARDGENYAARMFSILFEHDLLLLENQLPFFVLQKMHAFVYGGSRIQLLDIMKEKVADMLYAYTKVDPKIVISPTEEVHHLLHLSHMFFRPTFHQKSTTCDLMESSQMFRLGSAVQLYEAGVSFESRSDSTGHNLVDISFGDSGKMAMPSLHVEDNTDSLLRNLIALEQMKYPTRGLHVSAYAVLLLHLVTIPKDVELLRRKGIIQHHLASDKEMMQLVNQLSVGLAFDYVDDDYSLKPVFRELKRYSERRKPRWTAWLKHRYLNNPWTAIPLLAASILLILSALQTYITVYSYYHPCFDCS